MGYYAYSASAEFFIKIEDVQAALDALNKISSIGANFSDFEEAMADYNFIVEADAEGNYDSICFPDEKWRDADVLLEAIAPYVKNGSFIEMIGEDGMMWRWLFRDGSCVEQYVKEIIYEGI